MKLYRGLKSAEFRLLDAKTAGTLRATWAKVLARRARGDFSYPAALNGELLAASRLGRLRRQHFTDDRRIALGYARAHGGLLVEIDVPLRELPENFTLEFQNFGRRKRAFEIVYVVDAFVLAAKARRWKLRTRRPRL